MPIKEHVYINFSKKKVFKRQGGGIQGELFIFPGKKVWGLFRGVFEGLFEVLQYVISAKMYYQFLVVSPSATL